jgi:hypothetical protein
MPTKISQLPTASTPNGTELLEVVQAGSNKRMTIAQIRSGAASGGQMQALFGIITALSSGPGTLSGIATANGATAIDTSVAFMVGGLPQQWFLKAGTNTTGSGIQLPDDYNATTNPCYWVQWA